MIIDLKPKEKFNPKEWHTFWCITPRIIENKWVWLSRAERRLVGERMMYDGTAEGAYIERVYEYRLIEWVMYP